MLVRNVTCSFCKAIYCKVDLLLKSKHKVSTWGSMHFTNRKFLSQNWPLVEFRGNYWRILTSCPGNDPRFLVYLSATRAKQIIHLLLLNHFYPASYRRVSKESDELLLYGLVARYGPQSVVVTSCVHDRSRDQQSEDDVFRKILQPAGAEMSSARDDRYWRHGCVLFTVEPWLQ